jgi:hypothetical protein
LRRNTHVGLLGVAFAAMGCGPRAEIPTLPQIVPASLAADDSVAVLARFLAPTLYVQKDESFTLERVLAVVHPTRRVIAYHLLWRDDAHGAWIPFTKATDAEIVWVGYDAADIPVDVWTYWHGTILHTEWGGKGPVGIDVQWGKHGSLPRETHLEDLPRLKSLSTFYVLTWLGIPDFWLGNLSRRGPWCFCHGYDRYATFATAIPLAVRIDVVVRTENPRSALRAVFGTGAANKTPWPLDIERYEPRD